ncbi:Zinc finger, C2H2 domain and Zinc finger C2H2-type/integrase DNA-binding domain and Zinc finger, C2H2-like domain-containing protein [Strongyloides ratti]|uniref:Zinc finger, C2H2 domain and Zinc finger C2H2-type/integrase DNA-binding domain and Zinc finger, C2H2-like domain-containing protein n=1 Tax=Strongyloides ratti TaxID=34506 RepID=A0A090N045_STRRB|nr:Zinc finger, C2H2 domain and Zinc finger C2H2-type/integrase DNA-binding domain and Zinc finger, C2H2-like domain-containing protein [Strongyloides ratti]CEF70045.1 Zinc finger, C2H2 domain and Zinc finger C2H2-type/integrase DNA-binding domain and Zinc finger, C2H2-like domain-containing protein [Strongyloides ratti]
MSLSFAVVDEDHSDLVNQEEILEDDEGIPKQEAFAEIVIGEDGETYIITHEDAPEIDMHCVSSIQLVTNEQQTVEHIVIIDDGTLYAGEGPYFQLQENCFEGDFIPGQTRNRTVMTREDGSLEVVYIDDNFPYGMPSSNPGSSVGDDEMSATTGKHRRNRVEGSCMCPECGQTFINTARLERHLSVHQVFGSFQCPLCQKGYKYEYNLFYHWRKTCRDIHEIMSLEERKSCDVNQLRRVVDMLANEKHKSNPQDNILPRTILYASSSQLNHRESGDSRLKGKIDCRSCGVLVPPNHFGRHLSLHKGDGLVDVRSPCGGFFCDLCGVIFKFHHNLIKHWRTNCPTIQQGFEHGYIDHFTMDNDNLKKMVQSLLKRVVNSQMLREMEADYATARSIQSLNDPYHQDVYFQDHLFETRQSGRMEDDEHLAHRYIDSSSGKVYFANGNISVQCPECFRSFASQQRLDRHLQGYHRGEGTHHCVLCGHRFKYDYSLLFHYRKTCPFSNAHIEQAVREQSSAAELKKLVREVAAKMVNDTSKVPQIEIKDIVEDESKIHREMMRFPMPNESNVPPPLIMQNKDLENSKACPVCMIKFAGEKVLEMHISQAHKGYQESDHLIEEVKSEDIVVRSKDTETKEVNFLSGPPPRSINKYSKCKVIDMRDSRKKIDESDETLVVPKDSENEVQLEKDMLMKEEQNSFIAPPPPRRFRKTSK